MPTRIYSRPHPSSPTAAYATDISSQLRIGIGAVLPRSKVWMAPLPLRAAATSPQLSLAREFP